MAFKKIIDGYVVSVKDEAQDVTQELGVQNLLTSQSAISNTVNGVSAEIDSLNVSLSTLGAYTATRSAFHLSGYYTSFWSADGTSLIQNPNTFQAPSSQNAVFGNNRLVSGNGYNNRIYSSTDGGATWSSIVNPGGSYLMALEYAQGKFVGLTWGSNQVVSSTDGITWTTSTHPDNFGRGWNQLSFKNNRWIGSIRDSYRPLLISTDAVSWTLQNTPGYQVPSRFAAGNGVFLTNSYDGGAHLSTDGITWTQIQLTFTGRTLLNNTFNNIVPWMYNLNHVNGMFVANFSMTNYDLAIFTSTNGVDWYDSYNSSSMSTIESINYANGRWIVVDGQSRLYSGSTLSGLTRTLPDQSLFTQGQKMTFYQAQVPIVI
jgi:hypothetical protein